MLTTQIRNRAAKPEMLDTFTTADDMRAAISAMLFDSPTRLDIRHLWTRGSISYFRVNRWSGAGSGAPRVVHSSFVLVDALDCGWRVRERNEPRRGGAPPMAMRARQAA